MGKSVQWAEGDRDQWQAHCSYSESKHLRGMMAAGIREWLVDTERSRFQRWLGGKTGRMHRWNIYGAEFHLGHNAFKEQPNLQRVPCTFSSPPVELEGGGLSPAAGQCKLAWCARGLPAIHSWVFRKPPVTQMLVCRQSDGQQVGRQVGLSTERGRSLPLTSALSNFWQFKWSP